MKDMSAEELIKKITDNADAQGDAESELLSRIKNGELAVKAMEQLVDLRNAYFNDSTIGASKYYNSCDDVFDQWRNGNE